MKGFAQALALLHLLIGQASASAPEKTLKVEGVRGDEMLVVRGDRNYIGELVGGGDGRETLRFTLPREAFDLGLPAALSGVQLSTGNVPKVSFAGLPEAVGPSERSLSLGLLVGGALVMVVLGAAFLLRQRWGVQVESPSALAEKIALLDMEYKAGEMAETAYQRKRATLKEKLVLVLENSRKNFC